VTNDLPRFLIVIAAVMLSSLPFVVVPALSTTGRDVAGCAGWKWEGVAMIHPQGGCSVHGSELRRRSPVENIALDLLENRQLDDQHHDGKEKRPRENLGHVEELEPVVKLKTDP
jgi:hypothetical protein